MFVRKEIFFLYDHAGKVNAPKARVDDIYFVLFTKSMRKRGYWVEPLFGEAKDFHRLRRFRLRDDSSRTKPEKVNQAHFEQFVFLFQKVDFFRV